MNPKDADAYLKRGLCYGHLGYYDQAIADFEKCLALRPDDEAARSNIRYAKELKEKKSGTGDLDKSLSELSDALAELGSLF